MIPSAGPVATDHLTMPPVGECRSAFSSRFRAATMKTSSFISKSACATPVIVDGTLYVSNIYGWVTAMPLAELKGAQAAMNR